MSNDYRKGGPYIRNGDLVNAGNKFEAVKDENGQTLWGPSVQKQAGITNESQDAKQQDEVKKRPAIDGKIEDKKKELEEQKNMPSDKQKQHDKDKERDKNE